MKVYTADDHHIRNDLIDPNALYVLKKLHEAGYEAYLVGGGVRDLLMRKRPKDFDISTSAQPEQIKALFKRCLLIGRRFRLAHVRFGQEIIEVATFRSGDVDQEELILRDNIWGNAEQDVMRRDFTINGLLYDPLDHKIIDYVGGFEDLKSHTLRIIGNPVLRFKQDPVRMIRMQKFRARFGFHVEPATLKALEICRDEIMKSSQARILEEILRMMESGAAAPFFQLLLESGLLDHLFCTFSHALQSKVGEKLFSYLRAVDQMHQGSKRPLDRAILTAALLFPLIEEHLLETQEHYHMGQLIDLSHKMIEEFFTKGFPHFPRKLRVGAHFIIQMQFRLTPLDTRKRSKPSLARHRDFPQALLFLKLRSLIEPKLFSRYEYWKELYRKAKEEPTEK